MIDNILADRFGPYYLLNGFEDQGRCFWCGKHIGRHRRYCSETCKQIYHENFYWPVASQKCVDVAKGHCQDCGEQKKLVVHHTIPLDGERRLWSKLNRGANLVALCVSCHGIRHAQLNLQKKREHNKLLAESMKLSEGIDPICGWDWVEQHKNNIHPEPEMTIMVDGKLIGSFGPKVKRGQIRKAVQAAYNKR